MTYVHILRVRGSRYSIIRLIFAGRPPGPEMKNCVDRESYSLAAGLALGLVILGAGGGADLPASIPDTLHYYMVGGHIRPFSGAQKDKYKSPRYNDKSVQHVSCWQETFAFPLIRITP